jgi:hypothetical protein
MSETRYAEQIICPVRKLEKETGNTKGVVDAGVEPTKR